MAYKKPRIDLLPEILRLYSELKKTHKEIGESVGLSTSTVRRMLIRSGIELRSTDEINAIAFPKRSAARTGKKVLFSEKAINNIRMGIKRRDSKRTFAGVGLASNGYIRFTRGENYDRLEHTVIMERHIGRRLLPNEVVHHIDHNRRNNDISNLLLMTKSEHSSFHATERYNQRKRDQYGKFE